MSVRRSPLVLIAMLWVGVFLLPSMASAQANLAGLVQDDTGAVLPGVTIEASSPALIEQVRSVVTDGAGRYTIVNLRPGTYVVTFTLPGFSTVRREGVVLTGSGAVQLNVNLAVGQVEQAITVSGAAPVVDVQTTQQQFVVTKELMDLIPTTLRDIRSRVNLVPGATSFKYGYGQGAGHQVVVHGSVSTDTRMLNDGMWVPGLLSGYGEFGGQNFFIEGAQEEVTLDTDGQTAESAGSGIRMNAIPKEGGNAFSGTAVILGANERMQTKLDPNTPVHIGGNEVGRIGQSDRLKYTYDTNVALGGPIKKDKLWFFAAHKYMHDIVYVSNTFFPDGSQAILPNKEHAQIGRLTYQASPRNKIRVSVLQNLGPSPYNMVGAGRVPEASRHSRYFTKDLQIKWQAPITNRLLLDVGYARAFYSQQGHLQPGTENKLPVIEQSTGVQTGSFSGGETFYEGHHQQPVVNLSYVTGSHALKAGVSFERSNYLNDADRPGDISQLRFNLGRPSSVVVANTPLRSLTNIDADMGLYVQDRWTVKRFTLNLGVRYDHFKGSIPAQLAPAGKFVPARETGTIEDKPSFNDWAPRLGVAYDLFGTGRTALKASAGRYVVMAPGAYTTPFNPLASQTEARTWTDLDNNRSVLDGNGNVQYLEIGPQVNSRFGLPGSASRLDPNFTRPYNWETSVSLQHELRPGLSIAGGYHGRWYRNFMIQRNILASPDLDYYTYTITGPRDPRLPGGGGEVITMYDLNVNKRGLVDTVMMNSDNHREYTGFEVNVTARLPKGTIFGGITPERTSFNACDVENPNQRRFCSSRTPFQTLMKVSGTYTLPYSVELSGTFQARPGLPLGALYTVNNAIAGRTLTVVPEAVELIPRNTDFYDSFRQLDMRVGRLFQLSRLRTRAYVDIYNLLNGKTVFGGPRQVALLETGGQITGAQEAFGPNWLLPQRTQQARYLRVGMQIDF